MIKTKIRESFIAVLVFLMCLCMGFAIIIPIKASAKAISEVKIASAENVAASNWAINGWVESNGGTNPQEYRNYNSFRFEMTADKIEDITEITFVSKNGDGSSGYNYKWTDLSGWNLTANAKSTVTMLFSDMTIFGTPDDVIGNQIQFFINTNSTATISVDIYMCKVETEKVAVEKVVIASKEAVPSANWAITGWAESNGGNNPKEFKNYNGYRFELKLSDISKLKDITFAHKNGDNIGSYNYKWTDFSKWNLKSGETSVYEVMFSDLNKVGTPDDVIGNQVDFFVNTDADTTVTITISIVKFGETIKSDEDESGKDSESSGESSDPEIDPSTLNTVTFYKGVANVYGNVGDWIWFSNNQTISPSANYAPLGKFQGIRIILYGTKASMISEVYIKIGKDNYCLAYDNYSVNLQNGKNEIDLSFTDLINTGNVDLSTFKTDMVQFLLHTLKGSATDVCKLTCGIQFIGGVDENSDFDSFEADDKAEDLPYVEPDLNNVKSFVFLHNTKANVAGGQESWIWAHEGATANQSEYYLYRYDGIILHINGEKANIVDQYLLKLVDEDGRSISFNKWSLSLNNGKNSLSVSFEDLQYSNDSLSNFRPNSCELLLTTKNGTAADVCDLEVEIEFYHNDHSVTGDITLLNFSYKGGDAVVYDETEKTYTENRGGLTGVFTEKNGVTITVDNENAGQFWLTTGGKWSDQHPVDVSDVNTIYFNNYGSFDLEFYVSQASYIENILITFGCGNTIYSGKTLSKAIGTVSSDGWQHLRLNLDSLSAGGGFDWLDDNKLISLEIVVTVRAGTPVGEQIKFKSLSLCENRCDPSVVRDDTFSLNVETQSELDLSESVIATHPFDDTLSVSYSVKYSSTEDGKQEVISVDSGKFTPYKAGYYFVTVIVVDSMGASAQTDFVITATGDDVDMEDPSISFGSLTQYLSEPGEVNLSVITVTDDIDTDIVPVITVTNSDGTEIPMVEGKVNLSVAGVYTVTVTATDRAGHTKTLTRKITVEGESTPGEGGSNLQSGNEKGSSGCFGTIDSQTIAIMFLMVIAGVALRKKKEN